MDGLDRANGVALSADGKHAYVTGTADDALSWYERNASTGALTYGGMLKDGVGGVDGLGGIPGVMLSADGKRICGWRRLRQLVHPRSAQRCCLMASRRMPITL